MRPVTRNLVLGLVAVGVLLLALGALPSLLASGDPYYMTATPVGADRPAFSAEDIDDRRNPYATAALDDATPNETGVSDAYYRGPIGFKGAFTHSPFDELEALRQRHPDARDDGGVAVAQNGTVYRLAVSQDVP